MKITHSAPAFVLAGVLALAGSACATHVRAYGTAYPERDYRDFERRAYDNGYRVGFNNGQHDAERRRDFRVDRDRDFRRADDGFRGGNRREYQRLFRDGYRTGYADGFNRVARSDRRYYPR